MLPPTATIYTPNGTRLLVKGWVDSDENERGVHYHCPYIFVADPVRRKWGRLRPDWHDKAEGAILHAWNGDRY